MHSKQLTHSTAFRRFRNLLFATLVAVAATACLSLDPAANDRYPKLETKAGQTIPLQEDPQVEAGQSLFYAYLPAGNYRLVLPPGGIGETRELKLFRKMPIAADEPGSYALTIAKAGGYQILITRDGEDPHLRITKRKMDSPANPAKAENAWDAPVCSALREPLRVDVGTVFEDGEWIRDGYSGQSAQVMDGHVTFTPDPQSLGLLLLERRDAPASPFTWDNATVYFVVTDRFHNGRQDNDHSYGRKPDGKQEIGTFHGGDFAGLIEKLDYLQELGVSALWVTPPFEQIHGWVGGGNAGDFKHYAYHGYYAMDWTRLDRNMGTEEELRQLIQEAHARGIRVLFDVVMNHPGYASLQDMQDFGFGGLFEGFGQYLPEQWGDWEPAPHENYHAYHSLIDYNHPDWARWWGKDWVRAGIYDYDNPPSAGVDPVKGSLAFLPDFKTESSQPVRLPEFLQNKADTGTRDLPEATVRKYLVQWLTAWVENYGLDGFRVDTVKHVEGDSWLALKASAGAALNRYRERNPGGFEEPFWMVGEVFPHGVNKTAYFDQGFDALINFDFQRRHARKGAECLTRLEPVFSDYAARLNSDPDFNVMTYISSHDTELFSARTQGDPEMQQKVAAALLLLPGAVQIFYGDESARLRGPAGSDPQQGTRSDMNWADIESGKVTPVLSHWQKIGRFRQQHPAVGGGKHRLISRSPYAFARERGEDRVVIVQATQ